MSIIKVTEEERKLNEEKLEEFKALCKPLNEWLQKNNHPHTIIVIENNSAHILEQKMGVPFEVLD